LGLVAMTVRLCRSVSVVARTNAAPECNPATINETTSPEGENLVELELFTVGGGASGEVDMDGEGPHESRSLTSPKSAISL
jgi:hypothetical protein